MHRFTKNKESPVKSERTYNLHLRQIHFLEAVNKLRKKPLSKHQNLKRLCELASSSPAPQFYITPKEALEKYNEFKNKGAINVASETIKAMYLCIFDRYAKAIAANNGADFKYSVMQDVLESPAPSFFMHPNGAIKFYYRAMAYKRSLARK